MSIDERCEDIAKQLYSGYVPDWNLTLREAVMFHLKEMYQEGFEDGVNSKNVAS